MLGRLFLLFTLVTLVELALLIQLGRMMGLGWTLVLVFGTGFLGAFLARTEGVRVLGRMRTELQQGRVPADSMLDGVFVLLAGALLITPGVLTDVLGFVFLIAPLRAPIKRVLKRRIKRWIDEGRIRVVGRATRPGSGRSRRVRQAEVLDVSDTVEEPDDDAAA